jgi:transketolase
MVGVTRLLPELDQAGLNLKIVCAVSPQLFQLQPKAYREQVISAADQANSTVISTQSRIGMYPWIYNKVSQEYAITADWDNRWRTGGSVDEVLEEGHLTPNWLMDGICRFAKDKPKRMQVLRAGLDSAQD